MRLSEDSRKEELYADLFQSIEERYGSDNPKIEQYRNDLPLYAKECLKIRTRDLRLIPWEFNHIQAVLHEIAEKQRKELGYVRIIVAKRRRGGVSTYVQGRFYHQASLNPLLQAFTVAHESKSTANIFNIARLMQEENPIEIPARYSSRYELTFTNRSSLGLATAGSPEAARSSDCTLLHLSEFGFYEDADRALTAMMACVPDPPAYSEVWIESTGNGFGNPFQKLVFDVYAEGSQPFHERDGYTYAWKAPGTDWILVFFPWFSLPDATKSFDTEDQKRDFALKVDGYHARRDVANPEDYGKTPEKILQEQHGLSLEQLHWAEWKLKQEYRDKLEDFQQEYPATLVECFKSTGGNIFSAELCDLLEKQCRPPVHQGTLRERSGKVVSVGMRGGPLQIWESPQKRAEYLITIDPAGGMREHQTDKNAPDATCMDCWKRSDKYLTQVAQWHGHVDWDLIADEAILLAHLYGKAPIATLRANHGLTVIAQLKKEGWPQVEDEDKQEGILETRKSKPVMVDALLRDARDGYIRFNCSETIQEMRTFIERNKKLGAEDGCKDDRVSSAYCAVYANELLPRVSSGGERSSKGQGVVFANWARHVRGQSNQDSGRGWVIEMDD